NIIKFFGIAKDPKTNDFMMVMEYATFGDLKDTLKSYNSLSWYAKIQILRDIAYGLNGIHKEGLAHRDFYSGNILDNHDTNKYVSITDLGLCKPANETNDKKVYGVLPYVAPEILVKEKYTQKSDIYSFGIIIYEVCNELPPHYDMPHEQELAIQVCCGLRPTFNIKVPQLIENIAKQCVDADPLKRPTAEYLFD
ncbi:kinase-like domain-containing protein, partial [Glomus cerebriforme]